MFAGIQKKDGSGTKYTVGEYSSIDFEHNLVLYAIWCGGDLHQWSEPDYTWHYDYSGCLGETVCTRCGEEFWKTVSATVTQTTQECETPEQTVYTVDFGGTAPFTTQVYNDVHKPALGHDYQLLGFEWASDFLKAKVKLVCNRDASHTHEETVNTVKTNEVAATCQSQARITYTATYGEHSESQTQYLPALGHDFQFDSFVWGENGTAKAYYVCANDDRHQSIGTATVTVEETPPTSCFDGVRTYTATHQGNTGTKTEPIPGIGHDYEFKGFNWYLDLSKAKVMLVCKRDATHTHTVDVPSTMTVTTPATCLLDGVATYTVTYEGHTDSMTKRIPGGHRYQFDSFIWSGFSAMARVVCANDPTHVMNIPLTVTNELTTPATDHTDGLRTYTATYQEYSDTKTQLIPATGHSFGEDWEHDDTHHWHECEGCDAVSTHGEHVYDGEDDPDCNTCDYTRTITPPEHEHDWSADWEKNDTHHWHECQGEGICDITADSQKDGYGAHRYADDADTTCEDCGYVRTIVPTEPVTYTIIQGAEQEVVQGEEAIFVSDADLNLFEKVLVDGQALEEEDYTVESGSTKVTLTGACTAALSLGEHTLVIVSSDGKAETTFTVKAASQPTPMPSATEEPSVTEKPGATATPTPFQTGTPEGTEQPPPTEEPLPTPTRRPGDIPKTGDSSLPLLMLLLSAFCLGFALVSRRRKQAE